MAEDNSSSSVAQRHQMLDTPEQEAEWEQTGGLVGWIHGPSPREGGECTCEEAVTPGVRCLSSPRVAKEVVCC